MAAAMDAFKSILNNTINDAQLLSLKERLDDITTQGRCHKYALFMDHLNHEEADAVFWCLFLFQIFCLMLIVQIYDRVTAKYSEIKDAERDPLSSKALEQTKRIVRKIARRCLAESACLFIFLFVSTIMQVFAAHTILFCHRESLMHLYFPVWTVFSIGITFATLGCCITQFYALKSMKLPPFGVALGTPVLVVSALSHFAYNNITGRGAIDWQVEDGLQPAMSRSHTTSRPSDLETAQYSLSNGPIIQIWNNEEPVPFGGRQIGATLQGYQVIEHLPANKRPPPEAAKRDSGIAP